LAVPFGRRVFRSLFSLDVIPAKAGIHLIWLFIFLVVSMEQRLSLSLRLNELLFGIAPKSSQKGLAPSAMLGRASARPGALRFSPRPGCADSTSLYCCAGAAIHRRAPSGCFRPRLRCSAPLTAHGSTGSKAVHPWTA